MTGFYKYVDDNSFNFLKDDEKVVLCIAKMGENNVVKIPIVVSEMQLVSHFQNVEL